MRKRRFQSKEKCPWCGDPVHRPESAADAARHLAENLDWASREQNVAGMMRCLMPALRDAWCIAEQLEADAK